MARNDILKKLLKEAEESVAEDKVETAEEEKKVDEIKDEKLVDDAAKTIEDNHVVGGTDVAGDEPDTLPKELVKEDLAAEGEMEHTATDKPVEKEETGKEELKTKAAEERAEDHLTAAADIAGDKGDELPKDMVKEGTVVEDSLAITDNPVANQAEKVEELTDKAKDELANDKVIIVKKAETVAEPVIPASTDANPMGKVIESNEVKVEPEQQLEPGVKHADSELETTSDAKPAEKSDEVSKEETINKAAEERAEDHVASASDTATDEGDKLTKEQGEVKDRVEQFEESFTDLINFLKEENEIMTTPEQQLEPGVKHADSELETEPNTKVADGEASKETIKDATTEERAEDHVTAAADIAGDKGDELPKELVKEENEIDTVPEQQLEPGVKHADSELETDTSAVEKGETTDTELKAKVAEERAEDHVTAATDIATDKPDELPKELVEFAEAIFDYFESSENLNESVSYDEYDVELYEALNDFADLKDEVITELFDNWRIKRAGNKEFKNAFNKYKNHVDKYKTTMKNRIANRNAELKKFQDEHDDKLKQIGGKINRFSAWMQAHKDKYTEKKAAMSEFKNIMKDKKVSYADKLAAQKKAEERIAAAKNNSIKDRTEAKIQAQKDAEEARYHDKDSGIEKRKAETEFYNNEDKARINKGLELLKNKNAAVVDEAKKRGSLKESLTTEGEMEHTADDKPADKAEQRPEELKAKVAEERNEDHVSAATDVENDKPDCLCPEMVDEKYKSLKEAASLGKAYYRNPEHKAKLVTECALLSAKEAKDLIYEEYRKTVSKADMLKESLIAKYGKLAARRADIFLSRGLTEEYKPQRKLFDKLNEQIVINNIDRKIQLLEDSDVIFRNDDEIYVESIANLDRDDIASGYAAANVITEGTGFKAKFLKFGVKFLPEAKLRSTLTKIYSGAVEKANGNEAILKNIEKYNPEGKSKEEMQMLFNSLIDLCGTNVADLEEKAKETVESNKESVDGTVKESAAVAGFTVLALAFVGLLCTGTFIVKAVNALLNKNTSMIESTNNAENRNKTLIESLSDYDLMTILKDNGYAPTFENAKIIREEYEYVILDEGKVTRWLKRNAATLALTGAALAGAGGAATAYGSNAVPVSQMHQDKVQQQIKSEEDSKKQELLKFADDENKKADELKANYDKDSSLYNADEVNKRIASHRQAATDHKTSADKVGTSDEEIKAKTDRMAKAKEDGDKKEINHKLTANSIGSGLGVGAIGAGIGAAVAAKKKKRLSDSD